jgi:SAM-dependent methyltransferase
MSPDFSRRSTQPEMMDGDCDFATFRACLRDLAKVNLVTLAHRPILAFLEGLRRAGRLNLGRPVEIIDVGCGYGDLLRAIERWAASSRIPVRLTGVDLNPWSAKSAREVDCRGDINWMTQDVFAMETHCDIVISSLFTHHLTDEQIERFLRWMECTTGVGWIINDLHRHPLPYFGFSALARLANWHLFVRHDGPVSITRSFVKGDWRSLLDSAGLARAAAEVRWRFPFRLCVSRIKPCP